MTPHIPTDADGRAKRDAMEDLRIGIEYQILNLRETACVDVVKALMQSPLARQTMEYGFGGALDETARVSFSEFCIDHGAVDVLSAVLVAAPQGIDMRMTCCSANKVADSVWKGWRQSVHQHAVKRSSPDALRLALEYAPDERCLTTHSQVLHGTLHVDALVRLFASENVAGAAECCRILLESNAPMAEKGAGVGIASGIFFDGEDWGLDRSDFVLELLPEYIARGLVDLDGEIYGLKGAYDRMLPLRAAMAQGNHTGAAACIDLGCNIELAMTTLGPQTSTGSTDVLEVARSLALDTPELEQMMIASITAALMRRQLSAGQGNEICVASNNEESRRRRRPGV